MNPKPGLALAVLLLVGCAQLASGTGPPAKLSNSQWQVVQALRFQPQKHDDDCGEASLAMVLHRWGVRLDGLAPHFHGVAAGQLRDRARDLGLQAYVLPGTFDDLVFELDAGHPVIIGIAHATGVRQFSHFVVVGGHDQQNQHWLIADPDRGWQTVDRQTLDRDWSAAGRPLIVVFRAGELSRAAQATGSRTPPVCDHHDRTPEFHR